jgi:integrase
LALAAGLPVKVIAERLGHSSPAFTMSVYQHVLPSMQQEAADLIAEIVRRSSRQEDDARAE